MELETSNLIYQYLDIEIDIDHDLCIYPHTTTHYSYVIYRIYLFLLRVEPICISYISSEDSPSDVHHHTQTTHPTLPDCAKSHGRLTSPDGGQKGLSIPGIEGAVVATLPTGREDQVPRNLITTSLQVATTNEAPSEPIASDWCDQICGNQHAPDST